MANRILTYFLPALLLIAMASCYGDKDKEGSDNIQQVTAVGGISSETYTLYQGDTLHLKPSLSYSTGADTTLYDYRWVVGKSEVISNERNLDWTVTLPSGYSMASNIPGTFIVRNKENGLEFRQTFTFQVLSSYTPAYVAVYEKGDGRLEWMSLQGTPEGFTRWFDDMIERINPDEPLTGNYRGALYSTNELAIFTDHAPDYGRTISMRNADASEGFLYNVGEYTGSVTGNIYRGQNTQLSFGNIVFGYGASKYLIMNNDLYVFNGLDRKLPIYNEQTFVKAKGVKQAMSSKQFQRYKKVTFVLQDNGNVGCYHVYNDNLQQVTIDGEPLRLDSLCGCFTEATGMGSNQPYNVYLIGKRNGEYKMYEFYVNYIRRVVQPLEHVATMDVDAAFAESVKLWWGSFGESYAFYLKDNSVYRFDYYEMTSFNPAAARRIITFPEGYEAVDILPQTTGLGLRDEDYLCVALLYNRQKNMSSIYVYDTVSGNLIRNYEDIIPGRAVYFSKCL